MSSSMSSGWLTCRVCCSSAKYDGGGADRMRTYRDWETDRKSTRLNSSH